MIGFALGYLIRGATNQSNYYDGVKSWIAERKARVSE